jgi:methionyl-tRNA formyltransferase
MRIVILAHNQDRHYYFCNQVIKGTNNVVGIITGAKTNNNTKAKIEKLKKLAKSNNLLNYLKNKFLNFLFRKYGKAFNEEKDSMEHIFFNGEENFFFQHYSHLLIAEVKSQHFGINDPYYVSLIQECKPDIILVMGAGKIGKKITESAKHVINLHMGLSPYYKGAYTNAWPIIDECPNMFGVTIHEISSSIDAGNIIFTNQPNLTKEDNYGTINSKCIKLGTEKVIESIKNIENNSYSSIKQWASGRFFFNKDWNNFFAYLYFKKKKKIILKSIENAEKQTMPKINLVSNGSKYDLSDI